MRAHYHIWLIGAACALAVLVVASIFSLLDARDLDGADGARTTPTSVFMATAPPGDLPATAIGLADEGQLPAFGRMPAAHHALRMPHAPGPDRPTAATPARTPR